MQLPAGGIEYVLCLGKIRGIYSFFIATPGKAVSRAKGRATKAVQGHLDQRIAINRQIDRLTDGGICRDIVTNWRARGRMLAIIRLHGKKNASVIDAFHDYALHVCRHIGRQCWWNGGNICLTGMSCTQRGVFAGKQKYQAVKSGGRTIEIGVAFNN